MSNLDVLQHDHPLQCNPQPPRPHTHTHLRGDTGGKALASTAKPSGPSSCCVPMAAWQPSLRPEGPLSPGLLLGPPCVRAAAAWAIGPTPPIPLAYTLLYIICWVKWLAQGQRPQKKRTPVNTAVNRIVVEGDTAVGLECIRDGAAVTFRASREIILSAGGFNTPKLLMLSGIGDETELAAHGITTVLNATEVGKNVQDHILHGGCLYEAPEPIDYRNSAANISGYFQTDAALDHPDVSVVQIEIPYASEVIAKEFAPPPNTWALCGGLVAPKSRGTVKLASADPTARPIVDMQFLSHPDDVEYLSRSIRTAREIANAPSLKPFVVREVAPGKDLEGEELANFIRNGATTYFHASGACRMGSDDKAVVDAQLRVNGIRNLRIADSTIMPRIVTVPTMPACAMIGVHMADLLA